jgi:hypothetical protein
VVSLGIVGRVYVPSHLGVVLAIDVTVFNDESESSFLGYGVVEYLDEGFIDEVNAQAEDVRI